MSAKSKPKDARDILDAVVPLKVLAAVLDLSPQRVNALERQGTINKTAVGYPLVAAVRAYIAFVREEGRSTTLSAAAARVQEARARAIELRNAKEEHKVVDLQEANQFLDEIVGRLKSEVDSLSARVTRDLDLRRKMTTEIDDIFRRAVEHLSECEQSLRGTGKMPALTTGGLR